MWKAIRNNIAVVTALLYFYLSFVGYIFEFSLYYYLGLDALKYSNPQDFAFAILNHPFMATISTVILLFTLFFLWGVQEGYKRVKGKWVEPWRNFHKSFVKEYSNEIQKCKQQYGKLKSFDKTRKDFASAIQNLKTERLGIRQSEKSRRSELSDAPALWAKLYKLKDAFSDNNFEKLLKKLDTYQNTTDNKGSKQVRLKRIETSIKRVKTYVDYWTEYSKAELSEQNRENLKGVKEIKTQLNEIEQLKLVKPNKSLDKRIRYDYVWLWVKLRIITHIPRVVWLVLLFLWANLLPLPLISAHNEANHTYQDIQEQDVGRIRIMRPPLFADRVRHVASTGSHMVIALDECNSPAPQETKINKKRSSFVTEFQENVPKRLEHLWYTYFTLYKTLWTNLINWTWDWNFSASDVDIIRELNVNIQSHNFTQPNPKLKEQLETFVVKVKKTLEQRQLTRAQEELVSQARVLANLVDQSAGTDALNLKKALEDMADELSLWVNHDLAVIPWTNVASFDTTDGEYETCDSKKRWIDHEPAIGPRGETPLGQAIEYSVLFKTGSALLSSGRKEIVKAVRDGAQRCATETESLTVDIRGYASKIQFKGADEKESEKLNCALSGARVAEVLTTIAENEAETETTEIRKLGDKLKKLHKAYTTYMKDKVSEKKREAWHCLLLREFGGYCSNPPEPRSIKVGNLIFRWVATNEKAPWWLTSGNTDQELTLNRSVHLIPVERNGWFGACEFVQGVGQ